MAYVIDALHSLREYLLPFVVGSSSDVSANSSLGLDSFILIGCQIFTDSDSYSSIDFNRSVESDSLVSCSESMDSNSALPSSCLRLADCVGLASLKVVVEGD